MSLITLDDIASAAERIAPHVTRTPLLPALSLGEQLGCQLFVKCELFQRTGSFKIRGGFNKGLSLSDEERSRGIIAFSAGNHAMSVAHIGATLGVPVVVCMPAHSVQFKVDAVRAMGAELDLVDGDLVARAMARMESGGFTLMHPFDDPAMIAGHATCGQEIIEDLPEVDTVLVPTGGGGLISGVAAAIKLHRPATRVIGIEPAGANVVSLSRAAGHPVTLASPKSLADGLAAPIAGSLNLIHIEAFVDDLVTVPEESIGPAWLEMVNTTKLAVEPAAAVGVAAIRTGTISVDPDETVCMIASGGNADFARLADFS